MNFIIVRDWHGPLLYSIFFRFGAASGLSSTDLKQFGQDLIDCQNFGYGARLFPAPSVPLVDRIAGLFGGRKD
jgi:hypothetical protein